MPTLRARLVGDVVPAVQRASLVFAAVGHQLVLAGAAGERIVVVAYVVTSFAADAFKWTDGTDDLSGAMTLDPAVREFGQAVGEWFDPGLLATPVGGGLYGWQQIGSLLAGDLWYYRVK